MSMARLTRRVLCTPLLLLLLGLVAALTTKWMFREMDVVVFPSLHQRPGEMTSATAGAREDHSEYRQHVTSAQAEPVWGDLQARRNRTESVCQSSKHRGRVQGVFVNEAHKLAYCFVPKTGCTFWKRVFGFLNNDTGMETPVQSPFSIPRLLIHTNRHAYGIPWSRCKGTVLDRPYLRFMFSRDPYSRLWSTYLDKFFLPDFWTLFGGKILNQSQPRPNKEALMCGSNVTFTQFVDYTFKVNEPHWNPVSSSCDPCQFKPQVIGKMETYSRDARALLDRAGAGWIVDDVDHDTHVRHELETLIQYNFMVIHNKSPQLSRNKCISDEGLGARLWKTFQYNGYISDKVVYQAPSPFTQESFKQRVFKGLEESARYGKQELREQKGRALRSAFKQLAETTMQRIASKYDMDFRMFGYSVRTFQ